MSVDSEQDGIGLIKLEDITCLDDSKYSCSYNGISRSYFEYVPESDIRGIILMLHGYGSNGFGFRLDTSFDKLAVGRGYVVVFVDGLINSEDQTSSTGWNSGIGNSSIDDIGFLCSLASYLQSKYCLSKDDTFAAGFSNGAFMTYRLAVEAQDYLSGVASVAGMMPASLWVNRPDKLNISLLQINGDKDDVVPMYRNDTAKYSSAPAIEDVVDYFAVADGLNDEISFEISEQAKLTRHFSSDSSIQVWDVIIDGGRHSWPVEKYCGFDANSLILDYFDSL